MGDEDELRLELAQLLRGNKESISAKLERKFVEEYPSAKSNSMSAEWIHRWTLSELEALACAIETNDAAPAAHKENFGLVLFDTDYELSRFASSLASTLFMARHIAPHIFFLVDVNRGEGKGGKMLELYEETVRSILVAHCQSYIADIDRPGAIAKKWDMLSGFESEANPALTPLKKHRRVAVPEAGGSALGLKSVWEGSLLTGREKDVLRCLVSGKSNGEIAEALDIRQNTVKSHVASIFGKLGVGSRAELIAEVLGDAPNMAPN